MNKREGGRRKEWSVLDGDHVLVQKKKKRWRPCVREYKKKFYNPLQCQPHNPNIIHIC